MGTISTSIYHGITLATSGTYSSPLTITLTGYVDNTGTGSAVFGPNTQGWTVVNDGRISSYGTNSRYGVYFAAGGLVTNSGTIRAGIHGVRITGAAGTLVNSGTISSRGSASDGVTTIVGGASAYFQQSGTVINTGRLLDGIALRAGGYISNGVTGYIGPIPAVSGSIYAIYAQVSATTVVNDGTIAGSVALVTSGGTVSNSGVVTGGGTSGSGVLLGKSAYLENTATGLIRGFRGVYVPNTGVSGGTIVNHGTIEASSTTSSSGAGIQSRFGEVVTNDGTIDGNIGIGVYLQNQPSTVINYGLITATGTVLQNSRQNGILLQDNGHSLIINDGTIVGRSDGIYVMNSSTYGDTIVNNGLIQSIGVSGGYFGGTGGVEMRSHHTLINYGTITGAQHGVYGSGNDVAFVTNSGTIIATSGTGVLLKGGGTLTNSGTIVGNVSFGGTSSNLLVLQNGYVITGDVFGSSTVPDTLELFGTAANAVTASYNGLVLTSFDNVLFSAGGYATLQITNSGSFTFGLTISGFDQGTERIDLTGIGTDGQITSFNTTTDQVVITGSLGTATLQFVSIDGMNFTTASDSGTGTELVACFCRGTLIRTPEGEVPVERLAIGDRVVTASGMARPIKWIGRRAYDARFVAGNAGILPIRIEVGALADGVPERDLFVSPEHALVIDGLFLPARLLTNGVTIRQVEAVDHLEYFHIELDSHDVIFAEGTTAETFVDFGGRGIFQNGAEFAALYPDAGPGDWEDYAALLAAGEAGLPAIRAALLARAAALGQVSHDPGLHLVVGGKTVRAYAVDDRAYSFVLPAGAGDAAIASRGVVPAETEADSRDPRRLGVPLEQVVLSGAGLRIEIGPDCPALTDGFHQDEGSHRWTDGSGVLPAGLLDNFAGAVVVEVRIGATELHYPVDERIGMPASDMPRRLPVEAIA